MPANSVLVCRRAAQTACSRVHLLSIFTQKPKINCHYLLPISPLRYLPADCVVCHRVNVPSILRLTGPSRVETTSEVRAPRTTGSSHSPTALHILPFACPSLSIAIGRTEASGPKGPTSLVHLPGALFCAWCVRHRASRPVSPR